MKIRFLGGLILIFATGNMGFAIARSIKERAALLIRLQGLLQFLVTEIDFAVTIFRSADSRPVLTETNAFCHQQ